ncbi:hypothetical protein DY000_02039745 [Brassica cretica]|uniref:Uncharacterized protein n=1 Tax=Brassica cretica TaxID=69181 RepID=A0ABQ7B825_BRACR|nr:hypothetical protein DY000_02039745 [Brassica cretica]
MIHASLIHLVSPSLIIFVPHVMIHWCPLACSRARKGGTSHRSRLMEDVSNARVTVSTPPDVELYSRELNATGGAVVSPEIYAAKVWIAAITTHLLCDLHPCPCDNGYSCKLVKIWVLSRLRPNELSARFAVDRCQDVNIDRLFLFNVDRWSSSMVISGAYSKYLQNAPESSLSSKSLMIL